MIIIDDYFMITDDCWWLFYDCYCKIIISVNDYLWLLAIIGNQFMIIDDYFIWLLMIIHDCLMIIDDYFMIIDDYWTLLLWDHYYLCK